MTDVSLGVVAVGAATLWGDSFAETQEVLAKKRPVMRRRRDFIGSDFKPVRAGFRPDQSLDQSVADRIVALAQRAVADLLGTRALQDRADPGFAVVVNLPEVDTAFDLRGDLGDALVAMLSDRLPAPVLRHQVLRGGNAGPGHYLADVFAQGWDGLPIVMLAVDSMAARQRLMAQLARDDLFSDANPYGLIPGEAAVAVMLGQGAAPAQICGAGQGQDSVREDDPGDSDHAGLSQAWWDAIGEAEAPISHLWTDWNNGRYRAAQMSYAMLRTNARLVPGIDPAHIALQFGDTGAAAQLLALIQGLATAATGERILVSAHSRWSGLSSAIVAQRS